MPPMVLTADDGQKFEVWFRHDPHWVLMGAEEEVPDVVMNPAPRRTHAFMRHIPRAGAECTPRHPEPVRHASVTCHPTDQFMKRDGKKMALARLFSHVFPRVGVMGRDFRKSLWDSYLRQTQPALYTQVITKWRTGYRVVDGKVREVREKVTTFIDPLPYRPPVAMEAPSYAEAEALASA